MAMLSGGQSALACLIVMALASSPPAAAAAAEGGQAPGHDHVAVAIIAEG